MKVIYVAGPYRDPRGEYYIQQNIRRASLVALDVWEAGAVALCPHMNTAFFGGARRIEDWVWLEGDFELISRCDAIILAPFADTSEGTQAEIKFARKNNIPVFYLLAELKHWLAEE